MTQFDTTINGPLEADLISIDEAAAAFKVSRNTLYRLLNAEGIKKYKRAGDRKTYVSRSAIAQLMGFREIRNRPD